MPTGPVDQFSDASFRVLARRVRERPEFESLIKTASLNLDEHAQLPTSAFAWESHRLFPFHSPEHAALSYLYATEKNAGVPEEVVKTLEGALEVYGVKLPTEKVASAPAEESSEDYLLPELKRWKVTNAETVKLGEQALREYVNELTVEQRAHAAVKLVEKAASFGVALDPSTERTAGLVVSDLDTVRDWIDVRASVAKPEHKGAYEKVASAVSSAGRMSSDRESLVKLAHSISELDKTAGLDSLYGRRLPDPLETVFNTTKKAEQTIDLGGREVALSKLAALPSHVYADIFGSDLLPEITTGKDLDTSKLATVLPTLPDDLKKAFMRQMGAYLR